MYCMSGSLEIVFAHLCQQNNFETSEFELILFAR